MNQSRSDQGARAISVILACGVNGVMFASILLMGMVTPPPEPPELVAIDFVELARKSDVPIKPKLLPRITQPPLPLEAAAEEIGLKRKKQEELEKQKQEREQKLAEKKRKQEREKKKLEERKRKEDRKRRRKAMALAMQRIEDDPRADDEDAPGFKEGSAYGRSTDPKTLKNKLMYMTRISRLLESQFQVPNNIPEEFRRKASAKVAFKISKAGKVKGKPRIIKSSGNRFFDQAALTAVRRFGPGTNLKLPLPKDKKIKKIVLRSGIRARMKGK
ncbi:MAG: energy transducer TonB [Myxococcota bacterium]|nr:energy transducer TonB [Myxococcota bacterium]